MTVRPTFRSKVVAVVALLAATCGALFAMSPQQPAVAQDQAGAAMCQNLAHMSLPDGAITTTETVAAGTFRPPPGPADGGRTPEALKVPAFCRVVATLKPSSDSNIKMEVWLPSNGWNGKFAMVGNGGWLGSISYAALADVLARGYAVASTDTGHEGSGNDGSFAYHHPEKLIDFGWRAVHDTAVAGKAITMAFYKTRPRLSYWDGCSSGGKQGLKEAQKFPDDFDGIVAGAPANNWVRLETQSLWVTRANLPKGGKPILGPAQLALLRNAALKKCDAEDGVTDGEISDPRQCDFKPATLMCKAGAGPDCLTKVQVDTANKIYSAARNPRTGAFIFPGFTPGSEPGWLVIGGRPFNLGIDEFRYQAFNDPNWDFYTLDFDHDLATAEKADNGLITATNPDLSAFQAHGGKIIQYHGWADPLISPENSINYYESVVAKEGSLTRTRQFYRLFMVPNMGHCHGGYDPDWLMALENWVEKGEAPQSIIAKRVGYVMRGGSNHVTGDVAKGTGRICAYPYVARYDAKGDTADARNYVCKLAPRGTRPGQSPEPFGARTSR